jgi:hypothetical protein
MEIDPWSDSRWLTFLTESEAALVYHHPASLRVLEDAFGHEIVALGCADSDGSTTFDLEMRLATGSRCCH